MLSVPFQSSTDRHRAAKNLSCPCTRSQLRSDKAVLGLLASAVILQTSRVYFGPCFSHFCGFFSPLVILLFQMAPKCSPKGLSVLPSTRRSGCAT